MRRRSAKTPDLRLLHDVASIEPLLPAHVSGQRSLCFVIPFFNEAENLSPLLAQLRAFAERAEAARHLVVEAIFVDDGSTDRSAHVLTRAASSQEMPIKIRLVRLSRNFGKEVAITAGLLAAQADAVVLMDADHQHPIDLVEQFVDAWLDEGFDVVYAFKKVEHEGRLRRWSRAIYHRVINASAEVEIPLGAGDFRLLSRRAYSALAELGERERLMKGLYSWIGFAQKGIPYTPNERRSGESKFSPLELFWLGWNGITAFSLLPLRGAIWTGFVLAVLAAAYGVGTVIEKVFFGIDVPGYPTLITAIVFIGAAQLVFLGVLGEYVGKVLLEVKRRPLYVVESDVVFTAMTKNDEEPARAVSAG
jgi:glycosyltransferase involved in cell wall biosynthesis